MITQILDIFRRNLLKKIIALIAAFCMWVFVMTDQDPAINGHYNIPLTISNVPYDFAAVCETKTVSIEIRAPRSYFVKYNEQAFRVYANLEGLGEGDHQITPQVVMPPGFELVATAPVTLGVKIDPLSEIQMPIELLTTGSVAGNSAIKEIKKSMDFVTVMGAKSFAEKTAKVYGILNFSGNSSSFEIQIPLRAVDESDNILPSVRVVPSVITVSVDIESGIRKKIVPVVVELSAPEGWTLTKINVEPAQVEISGLESVLNPIVTLKTEPFTVQTGQRNFKGQMKLVVPEGVTSKSDEVTVSAEVIRKPTVRN